MIYPKRISAKRIDLILNLSMLASVIVGILLIIINKLTSPQIHWAALCNGGILWAWITVMYSIKKDVNIAGYTLIETMIASIGTLYMDYKLEFGSKGWSASLAIPIIIITANAIMLILTIVNHKRYCRYIVYNIIIIIFSMIPVIFIYTNIVQDRIISFIAIGISDRKSTRLNSSH